MSILPDSKPDSGNSGSNGSGCNGGQPDASVQPQEVHGSAYARLHFLPCGSQRRIGEDHSENSLHQTTDSPRAPLAVRLWQRGDRVTVAVIPPESEKQFQATVIELAKIYGWRAYYTHDSRRSPAGFPDLFLIRNGRIEVIECKSNTGKLTSEQKVWLDALSRAGIHCQVWRPQSPKEELIKVLQ